MPSFAPSLKKTLRRKKTMRIGTLISPRGLRLLAKKNRAVDCIEVRVDHLLRAGMTIPEIARALRRRKHPVLLTLRSTKEGGVYRWKKGERTGLGLLLLSHADAIDLEIDELSEMALLHKAAKKHKTGVVLSAHRIAAPATSVHLRRWIKKFRVNRALFYKIAGRINRPRDLDALANILKKYPRQSWALMGLGPDAPRSRAVLARLGSCAVYGYLDKPAASGQPSLKSLSESLR